MAINPQKLLPPGRTGGSLTKVSKKVISTDSFSNFGSSKISKDIGVIKIKVIQIENILKGTIAAEKKALDEKKRLESGKRREKQEEKLETKKQPEKGEIKTPKVPRMGFLDWIKNFIGNVLLGYFAVRMLDFLPKIKPIIGFLGSAADFLIDTGGKLLDGLVTFIDWGYKAIDFTRGMMKSIGGENFAKVFDGFTGAVGTLVETAIIAATVLATQGDGGVLDIGMDMLKDRLLGQGAQRAAQAGAQAAGQAGGTAAQAGGIGAGAVAGIVAGVGLLASALGEGAFQVRKVVVKPIQNLEKAYKEDKNPLTKIGRGIALNMVRPLYGVFSTVGFLLDVVGAPFRYAIELLRFPFLSEEDKQKQANNLAKFDARIREDLRKALNMVTLGLAFKEKGSFGNIYGNKGAQKEMMGKMSGGGITRGGKAQTGARRTIGGKKKYKRQIPRKPGEVEIKPGADIGGEDKIFGIFPNPLKAAQKVVDAVNPFNVVKSAGENLGKTDYFGPILAITSKITLGQKPSQKDYENVGLGINMLIAKGIQEKQLKGGIVAAFAEGGLVDPDVLSAAETGGDISNWVAKTFQGEIESNAQKTLRMIRENAEKKKLKQREEKISPTGDMRDAVISESEMDLFQRLIVAESGGQGLIGQALVARSVLNRAGLIQSGKATKGTFNAKDSTVTGVITGRGQYQPYADGNPNGSINRPRTQTQMSSAKEAIKLAQNPDRLKSLLKSEGLDDGTINKLLAATGFRAGYAFDDPSQNVNVVKYKDHYFNTAGNTALIVASSQVSEKINPISLRGGDGSFIQGNSGRSDGTHFHIGTTKPGDGSGVAAAGFNVIKHFLGKKSIYVGRSGEFIPANATDDQIRGYIGRGQAAHRQTELDLQIGGIGAGNKVAFPLALRNMRYSETDGYGVSADIVGVNAFVGHGRYKPDGTLALQQRRTLNLGAPDFYAFHGESFGIVPKGGMKLTLHEGEMFRVFDRDTVESSVNLLGYDLTKEIIDIENKAQLVAKAPSIIERLKSISGYADYEQPYAEPQIIEVPVEVPVPMGDYQSSGGGVALIPFGGGDDPFETLYKGG